MGNKMLWGIVLIIIGLLYLLVDLGVWDFWGISWWTVAFLFMGLMKLCPHKAMEMKK